MTNKGQIWGGICNTQYCTRRAAVFFNAITGRYNCETCSDLINDLSKARNSAKPCEEVFAQLSEKDKDVLIRQYHRKMI